MYIFWVGDEFNTWEPLCLHWWWSFILSFQGKPLLSSVITPDNHREFILWAVLSDFDEGFLPRPVTCFANTYIVCPPLLCSPVELEGTADSAGCLWIIEDSYRNRLLRS